MRVFNRASLTLVSALVLMLSVTWAMAQVPQSIIIDGINDFLPANLVEDDGGDTQHPNIDIGGVYVTNDAVNFYLGMDHDADGWGTVQLGLAIDVGTADGGIADPWGRQLEWSDATNKPDFMFYINLDNNWQASYYWDGGTWVNITQGPGNLGWHTGSGFNELAIMLGSLGVSSGEVLNYEAWVTQDGGTKGPLDAVANDGSQLSVPGFTEWETAAPIPMPDMLPYTVQAAADPDPPVVVNVSPTSFPVDSFFDVYFNEPVDATTAGVPGNYVLSGGDGDGHQPTSAMRDASDPSIVHLTFNGQLDAAAALYTITVGNVEDLAGNPILENGTDNVNCFMLKDVTFRGKFGPFLSGQTEPIGFTVEGAKAPLTWDMCDTGVMVDTGTEDIWQYATTFCVSGDCVAGTAVESFEWKFVFNCVDFEPLPSNRVHTLDLANGSADVIEVWWNDEDPSTFTNHAIDVELFVDMNDSDYLPGDIVAVNGSELPLTHDAPSLNEMVDDGTGNDAVAGDLIFSTLLTFPAESRKDVTYKFLLNDVYECDGQGDRTIFLNDELYDTVGGVLGPLTLPVVKHNFCNAIWRAVEVVFTLDFNNTGYTNILPGDVVGVNGTDNNATPPTFDWTIPSLNQLNDDGVWPDATAGDKIYSVSVVFPDTSTQNVEYKYLVNDVYECPSQSNRHFAIDPDNYDAVGNPQILEIDVFQRCNLSDVLPASTAGISLAQNMPNPFNPSTEIRFSVPKAGSGSLRVYNVRGQMVRSLQEGHFEAGNGSVMWDGRTESGTHAGSGVYFYKLDVDGDSVSKRMVLLK
jgi:FlgD Ig-like domain/Bacterial Ig-like domain